MIPHVTIVPLTVIRARQIRSLIRQGAIRYGGNRKLKIYGTLHCSSGKKMLHNNRVFFASEAEALAAGYLAGIA
jgi:methylphosphotriester-DNA--protein-cysteine methyltransferase